MHKAAVPAPLAARAAREGRGRQAWSHLDSESETPEGEGVLRHAKTAEGQATTHAGGRPTRRGGLPRFQLRKQKQESQPALTEETAD